MAIPDQNPTFTKVDDDVFYLSTTSTQQLSVAALKGIIQSHQDQIRRCLDMIASASVAGLAAADPAIADVLAVKFEPTPITGANLEVGVKA